MHRTKLVSNIDIAAILKKNSLESILTEREKGRLTSFLSPRRKQEWLGGRIAAKWLLGDWLKGHFAIELNPNEIEILNDEEGRPYALFRRDNKLIREATVELCISISHIDGFAIAAFSTSQKVGVDLVQIKGISVEMQHYFLNEEEVKTAQSFGPEGPALFWAIKEAYLKAIGTGFSIPPKSISIQVDLNSKKIRISGTHEESDVFFEKPNDRMLAAAVLTNR